jgi:hypothetical protein
MSGWEAFGLGVFGGFLSEAWVLFQFRHLAFKDWPEKYRRRSYWIPAPIVTLAGGVIAWAGLAGQDVHGFMAIWVGLAAPLIIEKSMGSAPDLTAGGAA